MKIELPISKSIANRVLIRRAMRGDDVSDFVSSSMPDDVQIMAGALLLPTDKPQRINIDNCGTAMRFLTAYFAQKERADVVLDGCERMHERPIGQEVDALRKLGADIEYLGAEGFPPLRINGRKLCTSADLHICINQPASTQFVSALILIGANVTTDVCSPYIEMTRAVVAGRETMERDWSAAAFWLERKALGLMEDPEFPGLEEDCLQGDRVAKEIFEQIERGELTELDCSAFPDLVPAIAVTCHLLKQPVKLTGTESLRIKESDRLQALEENFKRIEEGITPLCSYNDHRIAMAFMAAGFEVDNVECIRKSYPLFVEQIRSI